ncbi:MAG: pseudaminic acid biosynthesis-associated methylase [Candidatus Aureabacteria bacterium]|nr:pseudaminic acid biosynthesis-associated methylase [Candidatus Auribacterota bacterium]
MVSNNQFKTEQEAFWSGDFGDEYIDRNRGDRILAANTALFARILSRTHSLHTLIEFGANIGLNLTAIKRLLTDIKCSAVEINQKAAAELRRMQDVDVFPISILDYRPEETRDFAFTKGLLIHIEPAQLPAVYSVLYCSSHRYICIVEYYNPVPVECAYRGHKGKLFKRDFAGEMLDMFPGLTLVDYGFAYHRDSNFGMDDLTWFLMRKGNV